MSGSYIKRYVNKYSSSLLSPASNDEILLNSYTTKDLYDHIEKPKKIVYMHYTGMFLFVLLSLFLVSIINKNIDETSCIENKLPYKILSYSLIFIGLLLWNYIYVLYIFKYLIEPVIAEGKKYEAQS